MNLKGLLSEFKRCSRTEWIVAAALVCLTPTLMHMLSPKVLHAKINGMNSFYGIDPTDIPAGTPGAQVTIYGSLEQNSNFCFYTGYGSNAPLTPSSNDGNTAVFQVPADTIQKVPISAFANGLFLAQVYAVNSSATICNGSFDSNFSDEVSINIDLPALSSVGLSSLPQPNPNLGPITRPSLIDLAGSYFSSTAIVKYTGYANPASTYIDSGSIRAATPATGTATSLTATVCNEGPIEYCTGSITIPIAPLDTQTGTLTATPSPTTTTTPTSLTATFAGNSGVPNGTVTFKDGTSTLGTSTLALTSGKFVLSPTTPNAANPENTHAIVADFNKDGIPDVLLYTSYSVDIFLASSIRGTFAPDAQMPLDSSYCGLLLGVTTGDFNQDGYIDLALLCTSPYSEGSKVVLIYHNNGDGTFTQDYNPALSPAVLSLHPSLAGVPAPHVSAQPNISFPANQSATLITSADINKDGRIDIILAGPDGTGNMAIQTYPGMGGGNFDTSQPEIIAPSAYGTQIAAVDLNNDGYPDLILLNDDSDSSTNGVRNLVVFQNNGAGSFPSTPTFQVAPGDGKSNLQFFIQKIPTSNFPNIVVINTGATQQITTLVNSAKPTIGFTSAPDTTNIPGVIGASMGDFNGDGYPDIAIYSTPDDGSTYKLDVYPSSKTPSGQYSTPTPSFDLNVGSTVLQLLDNTSDPNGDGYADPLVLANDGSDQGAVAQFLTAGTSTATLPAATFTSGPHNLAATNLGTLTYAAGSATTTLQSNGPGDTLTLSTTPISPVVYGSSPYNLVATITTAAGTPVATGTVRFFNATAGTLLGTGTLAAVDATHSRATLSFGPLNAGTYSLSASYLGDSTYPASSFTPISFVINKATPVVAYAPTPTTITSGTKLVASQLTGAATATFNSATVAGSFTFTNSSGVAVDTTTVLPVGNNVITARFTPTDTTDYNTASSPATIFVKGIPTLILGVNPSSPTTYSPTGTETLFATVTSGASPTPSGTVQFLDGTTALGGPRTLIVSSGSATASLTVGPLAPGPHSLSFTYSGDTTYTNATSTTTNYVVNQTTPTVNYTLAQPTITYGTPVGASNLVATATSGGVSVPGSFAFTDASSNPVTASTIFPAGSRTITATFTPTDTSTYSSASKTVTLTVNKATPVISFVPNPNTITYPTPLSAAQLDATVSGNLPGSFSYFVSGTSVALVVNAGTVLGVGTYNFTANFTPTDTANYNSAAPVTTTLTVTKGTPTVTYVPTPATIPANTPLVASQLNASSTGGGTGSFAYTNAANQPVTVGTVLPVGNNVITATFTPSDGTDYNTAFNTGTINVAGTASAFLSVNPTSPTTYSATAPETLFATVSSTSSPSPTGSVQFFDGATSLGTKALTLTSGGGTASLTLPSPLLPGPHSLKVTYLGDSNYATVTSTPTSYVVNQTTPTLTYNPLPASISYGTALVAGQLNATSTAPGTFTYTFGGTPVNTTTVLPAGSDTILATFTPTDTVTYTAATKTAIINVGKATPVITYTPAPATITYGTALVAGQLNATTTVPGTFAYTLGTTPVNTSTILPAGANVITATFTPTDTNSYAVTTKTATINVTAAAPTVTYTPNPASIVLGTPIVAGQLNAIAQFNSTTVPGTFAYTANGNPVIAGTILPVGANVITAAFTPTDTTTYSATSKTATINVSQGTPSVFLFVNPASPTTYTATGTETLSVNVSSPTAPTPTGTVKFMDGAALLGTKTLTPSSGSGTASLTVGPLLPGPHTLTAIYSGDASYTTLTSTPTNYVVNPGVPTLTYSPLPATITYGTALVAGQLNATATFAGNSIPGAYTYALGATPLTAGSILPFGSNTVTATFTPSDLTTYTIATRTAVINVTQGTPVITYNPVPNSIVYGTGVVATELNAVATLGSITVPGTFQYIRNEQTVAVGTILPVGPDSIGAYFTPTDPNAVATAFGFGTINVTQGTANVNLSVAPVSPTTYSATGTETLTAMVTSGTSPTPTGSVQFFDGTTSLGTAPLTVSGTTSTASLTVGPLAAGPHSLTAAYIGDSTYATITSLPSLYTVNKATPALTYAPSPAAITYGTGLVATQLNATSSVAGTFAYTLGTTPVTVGTKLPAGLNTLTATFTPTDAVNYLGATRTAIINVGQASPTIVYTPSPAAITYGTALVANQLSATASFAGNTVPGAFAFTSAGKPVAIGTILPAGANVITATFTPTDTLSYAITSAPSTINVGAATPVLTYTPAPTAITYGTGVVAGQLNATAAFAGNTVPGAFAYTSAGRPVVLGTILPAGANIITATFTPTDTLSYAVTTTTSTINVGAATPLLAYTPAPATITYGAGLVTGQLNAVAAFAGNTVPGTVAYTLNGNPVTVGTILSAGANVIRATFTPTDAVTYTVAATTAIINVGTAAPTIVWTPPSAITAGTPLSATQLNARATGIGGITLPGAFTYTPAAGTILPVGPATLSVNFVPTDTANYSSITSTVPLTVQPALTTTTLTTSPNPSQFGQPVTLSVSVSSPYVQVPLTGVVNVYDGGNLIGSTTLPSPSVITSALTAGPHTITAIYQGTSNFATSTSTSITQTVASATTTLTWPTPASIPYGTRLSATQLNAAVSTAYATTVPGTFVYTPAAGTLLTAGTQALSVVFTPTDTVNFKTATASVNLVVTKINPTLTWTPPANFPAGTPLSATQLNARAADFAGAALPGVFTYTPAAGTILAPGATSLSATFVPTDAVDYNTSTISVPLTVDLAAPIVTVTSSANPAQFGQPVTFSVAVTSIYTAAPLTGTLKVFDGTTLLGSPTLTAGQATLPISTLTAGPHSITAVYGGNTNFATATSTALTQTINAATTTITWPTPADIPYGTRLSATQLNATVSTAYATTVPGAFVYTPASGTLLPAGPQTLSVTFTPTDTVNFKPVTSTVTLNVGKIAPVITWTAPADVIAGTTLSSTQLNATAAGIAGALPGTFTYTPPAGTILTAGTQTLSTTFTPTDLANYTAATASVPLNVIGLSLTALSSTTASLGQAATTITLTGTGFATDAIVKVDGTAVATTYVSRTSLTAIIPASVFLTTHTIQVQVVDQALAQTSNTLQILMNTPPISVVFQGPPTVTPGQQPTLTFTLPAAYPVPVSGTFTITFTPASGLPAGTDDPTIVFPNGKRTFDFTIPANSTATPPVVLQSGSVAGTITVTLSLAVNGQTVTPVPAVAPVVIAAPAAVPGITSVVLTRNGNTLTVSLFGYSNIRQVDHATFHFIASPGQDLKTTDITVDGATLFAPYYASPASIPVGGSFEYDQVFNLDQNAIVVGEVQVNLYNSLGQSLTGTAQ